MVVRWLGNVLSGRFRYWNETHNRNFAELWERCNQLPPPYQDVFKELLISSNVLMEKLVGPDRERLLPVRLKSRERDLDLRLFGIQLAALAGMYAAKRAARVVPVRDALRLLPDSTEAEGLYTTITKEPRPDLWNVGSRTWTHILRAVRISGVPTPTDLYQYAMYLGDVTVEAFKAIDAAVRDVRKATRCRVDAWEAKTTPPGLVPGGSV